MAPPAQAQFSSAADALKRAAAERAADFIESGMRVGFGTGSTAYHFLEVVGERIQTGSLTDIIGVATSTATIAHAREVGIPLLSLDEQPHLDVTVDGADEVGPGLDLIKGHGGALLWEKMVAAASDRLIIVADDGKLVGRLGAKMALPVEVIPFGWSTHLDFIAGLGARSELRMDGDSPFLTDGGHFILHCTFEHGIEDPAEVARVLKSRAGIVETGLFVGMAGIAVIAGSAGVRVLDRTYRT